MKDGEGQLVTNTWTVTESLNPEAAVPSLFSSGLPNEFASLPSFHVCSAAKWVSNGPRRELTEIEKKIHRDVLRPRRHIHYRHNYVGGRAGVVLGVSTKQAFKVGNDSGF